MSAYEISDDYGWAVVVTETSSGALRTARTAHAYDHSSDTAACGYEPPTCSEMDADTYAIKECSRCNRRIVQAQRAYDAPE